MSIGLFSEQPIVANKSLARALGLHEALVLQQLNYWIEINKKSGNNFFEGRYWTYNSIRAWHENDFDYMSLDCVKRTFTKLIKDGYLIVGNFNKDPRDKTKWYAINDERLEELWAEIDRAKQEEERKALEKKSLEDAENALCKSNQSISAFCTNAYGQNPPMHVGKIHQPLPEITTEITTENSTKTSFHPSFLSAPTNQSPTPIHSGTEGWTDGRNAESPLNHESALEVLRDQVGYLELLEFNPLQAQEADEVLPILADVLTLRDEDVVTINQIRLPARSVKDRFLQLTQDQLVTLCEALRQPEHKIRNVRAFVLTAAYNAPVTTEANYTARVAYDFKDQWR